MNEYVVPEEQVEQVVATLLVQAVPRPEEHGLAYPGRERDVYRSFDLNYYVVDVKDKEREREGRMGIRR